MSGFSTSFTFPSPHSDVESTLLAFRMNDEVALTALFPKIEPNCLTAITRNSGLENNLWKLIRKLEMSDLDYLARAVDIAATGERKPQWFVASLAEETLESSICALRHLILSMREQPDRCLSVLVGLATEDEIVKELSHSPTSIAESFERFRICSRADDGDDFPTLASYLRAHLSVLEFARNNSVAAVYASWLYQ